MKTRLLHWMLVAGLFVPAAPGIMAQGVIVTTLPAPIGMSSDLFSTFYPIDVNGDGLTDFTFGADPGFIGLRTELANQLMYRIDPPPNLGGLVANLPVGFGIGSSLEPQLGWRSSDLLGGYVSPGEIAFATIAIYLSSGSSSEWPGSPGARGFIGIQLELDDGFHFGYFDVVMAAEGGGVLLGWAYNSIPNASIFASPVPEPSAGCLLMVGGILLAFARRGSKHT
jgi:hypothetical protein